MAVTNLLPNALIEGASQVPSGSTLTVAGTLTSTGTTTISGIDCNGALDLDHALTAAGDLANIAGTINHATDAAQGLSVDMAQLTAVRSAGVVSGVKSAITSLASSTGGTYASFESAATDGGGTALHVVLYSASTEDALVGVSASGKGGVVVSADGMTADPEADAEAGYGIIDVGGTLYQFPIYAA